MKKYETEGFNRYDQQNVELYKKVHCSRSYKSSGENGIKTIKERGLILLAS